MGESQSKKENFIDSCFDLIKIVIDSCFDFLTKRIWAWIYQNNFVYWGYQN